MADDVLITAGSGTTIAADEKTINSVLVKVQRMNMALGKDGTYIGDTSGRLVDGDANASALFVDPRELVTEVTFTSAGLTTATTAYTAGDVLGTELTVASVARVNAGYLTIVDAKLVDAANIIGAVDAYIFNAASTPAADNAANAWADADMVNLVGLIHFGDVIISANNRITLPLNLPLTIKCGTGTTSLFMVLVTRAAHTFFGAVGNLTGRLLIAQH